MNFEEANRYASERGSFDALPALLDLFCEVPEGVWLKILGQHWSRFDNVAEHLDTLQDFIAATVGIGPAMQMMNATERAAFESLPDTLTIYRGCYAFNKYGASWSLDRDVAERFPFLLRYRQDGRPLLIKATIGKQYVTALKLDRGEDEIVILGQRPKVLSISTARAASREGEQ